MTDLTVSIPTRENIIKLFQHFGFNTVFSRADVMQVIGITATPATELMRKMKKAKLIESAKAEENISLRNRTIVYLTDNNSFPFRPDTPKTSKKKAVPMDSPFTQLSLLSYFLFNSTIYPSRIQSPHDPACRGIRCPPRCGCGNPPRSSPAHSCLRYTHCS